MLRQARRLHPILHQTAPLRNTPASDPVEQARAALRTAVARSSIRAVAKDAQVDHTRLAAFVAEGSTVRPRGAMLEAVLAYAERGRVERDAPAPAAPDAGDDPYEPEEDPGADGPGFWRGYLAASKEILDDAHEMQAQANALSTHAQAMVARATARIGRMVAAGPRWEAATVRARELRMAASTAATRPARTGEAQAQRDTETQARVDAAPTMTEEEARAEVLRRRKARRTG